MLIIIILLFIFSAYFIYAIFTPSAGLFIPVITQNINDEILFTFDDGPHPIYTPLVLDLLKKNNKKGAFFLIGKNVAQYPEIAKRIYSEGHIIGNHTYNHTLQTTFLSSSGYRKELSETNDIIQSLGIPKPLYFRPPFGVLNPSIAKAVKEENLQVMGWSIRSFDTTSKNPTHIFSRVVDKLKPKSIVLLHDSSSSSVEAFTLMLTQQERK